jgi:hypothetical protein
LKVDVEVSGADAQLNRAKELAKAG